MKRTWDLLAKGELQQIIKVEGLNHYEASWDNQGFTDSALEKWQPRKEPQRLGKRGKVLKSYKKWKARDKGRAILVSHRSQTKGGHLKDSLRADIVGVAVEFYSDKPYAEAHNEGNKHLDKRQFMGESQELFDDINGKVKRTLDKTYKSL